MDIRPEHFVVADDGPLTVTIDAVEHAGSDAYVMFRICDTLATARFSGRFSGAGGYSLRLGPESHSFFDADTGALLNRA